MKNERRAWTRLLLAAGTVALLPMCAHFGDHHEPFAPDPICYPHCKVALAKANAPDLVGDFRLGEGGGVVGEAVLHVQPVPGFSQGCRSQVAQAGQWILGFDYQVTIPSGSWVSADGSGQACPIPRFDDGMQFVLSVELNGVPEYRQVDWASGN